MRTLENVDVLNFVIGVLVNLVESSSFSFTCFQLSGNLIMQVSLLGPIYTKRQRQRCDDACDSVLIENNRVAPEWGCNLFSSDSFVFNENRIASVITALTLILGVNGPLWI